MLKFWMPLLNLEKEFNDFMFPFFGGPKVDATEEDDKIIMEVELPGLSPEEVDVGIENKTLTIKGKKEKCKEKENKRYFISERNCGNFCRSFDLPDTVDIDNISAKYDKGILYITIPKNKKAPTKKLK